MLGPASRPDSTGEAIRSKPWCVPARVALSLVLAWHIAALLTAALATSPSSSIERRAARSFKPYTDFINQGYGYRMYSRLVGMSGRESDRRWGTPVVTIELLEGGGESARVVETIRLPDRNLSGPRLRYQRQLDLAYHLSADPEWAASFARHLCKTRAARRVRIFAQTHQIPDLAEVHHAAIGHVPPMDLEAASTYTERVSLGEYSCDAF